MPVNIETNIVNAAKIPPESIVKYATFTSVLLFLIRLQHVTPTEKN